MIYDHIFYRRQLKSFMIFALFIYPEAKYNTAWQRGITYELSNTTTVKTAMRREWDSPWRLCWRPPVPPLAPAQTSVQRWRPWWPGPWVSWAHLQRALADLCIYWHTPGSHLWSGTGSWVAGTCAPAAWTRSHSASPPGWRCPPCSNALALWTGPGTPPSSACTVSRMSVWTCCWETSQNCPAAPRKTLDGGDDLARGGRSRKYKQLGHCADIYSI